VSDQPPTISVPDDDPDSVPFGDIDADDVDPDDRDTPPPAAS
jgi:hypothetical protein